MTVAGPVGGAGSATVTVEKLVRTRQMFASAAFMDGDDSQAITADKAELFPFQPHHQHHQVYDEQQHDGRFQHEHPTVGLVVFQQLVEVVERLELAVNRAMPVAEVETQHFPLATKTVAISVLALGLDARLGDRIFAVGGHLQRRGGIHRQLVHARREFVRTIEHVLIRYDLARVRGHAAH